MPDIDFRSADRMATSGTATSPSHQGLRQRRLPDKRGVVGVEQPNPASGRVDFFVGPKPAVQTGATASLPGFAPSLSGASLPRGAGIDTNKDAQGSFTQWIARALSYAPFLAGGHAVASNNAARRSSQVTDAAGGAPSAESYAPLGASHEHMVGLLGHINFTREKVREAQNQRSDIVAELQRQASGFNLGLGGVMISLTMVLLGVGPFIPTPVGIVLLLAVVIGLVSPQGRKMLAQNFLGEPKLDQTKQRLQQATQRLHFCEGWLKATQAVKVQALVRSHQCPRPLATLVEQLEGEVQPERERTTHWQKKAKEEFLANQSSLALASGAMVASAAAGAMSSYAVFNYPVSSVLAGIVTLGTGVAEKAVPAVIAMARKKLDGPAQLQLDVLDKRFNKWMACRQDIYDDLVQRYDLAEEQLAAAAA